MAYMDKDNRIEELAISLPVEVLDSLNNIAQSTHTHVQELILSYINEGILRAQPKQKKRNFIKHSLEALAAHNAENIGRENIAEKFTYKYL